MPRFSRLTRAMVLAGLLLGLAAPASAEVGVGAQIGTLGLQAMAVAPLNKNFSARLGVGVLPSWSFSADVSDLTYDFQMHLYTLGAFLDWHPAGSGFRFSGGVIFNAHDIKSSVKPDPNKTFNIGGVSYTGAQLGTLDAKADFNKLAPYLGIGYNGAFRQMGNLFFTFELGVMFWGAPDVTLTASNPDAVPGLRDSLRKEESDLESKLDFLQYYPVAAVGVTWTF